MEYRLAKDEDHKAIEELTRDAFWNVYRPGCNEHLVIHNLRKQPSFIKELECVCLEKGKMVGHIAYSRLFYGEERTMSEAVVGFGPISVHPDFQKRGIGKKLIQMTEEKAVQLGYKAILITGNTAYYHPLGYTSASSFGVYYPGMPKEDEAAFFMAKELEESYLKKHPGTYGFDAAFNVDNQQLEEFEKQFAYKEKSSHVRETYKRMEKSFIEQESEQRSIKLFDIGNVS